MSQIRYQQVLSFNADVIASTLTAYTSGAGLISSADSLLGAIQKLNGNMTTYLPLVGGTLTGALILNADPSTSLGAATKNYVDNLVKGLVWTEAACAATTNITLSGEQTIDGVTTSASVVLLMGQTTNTNNGIWLSGTGAWTRATDFSTGAEIVQAVIIVKAGTLYGSSQWVNTNSSITLGTTAITFAQMTGNYTNGAGITLTGNVFSIGAGAVTNSMLAGSIAASKLVGTDIATVGTITTGTWNGTAIANVNLANSTISGIALGGTLAALSATNASLTFSGSYTGTATQTVGINYGNASLWTVVQTVTKTALGSVPVDAFVLQNTTAAISGTQQCSPYHTQIGFGWGTTGGTSQAIKFSWYVLPIQGATATGLLTLGVSLNLGTYSYPLSIDTSGNLTANSFIKTSGTSSQFLKADGSVDSSTYLTSGTAGTTYVANTHFIVREAPSGLINSSNVTYTLANTPVAGKESIYLNGLLQTVTTDYTISTNTITMGTAPFTGDTLTVNYIY